MLLFSVKINFKIIYVCSFFILFWARHIRKKNESIEKTRSNQKIQEYMKNRYVHKWITSIVVLFQINQKTNVNYVYTADVFDKKKFS